MSEERKVDVAIIGAGTAGLSAYSEVRKVTDNFVVIHHGPHGTTCARVGCMPSKVLIQVANDFHRRHALHEEGILGGEELKIDRARVLSHVRSLRDHFVRGVLGTIEKIGDRVMPGYARFREPTVLDVDGRIVRARRTVIATGSRPVVPEAWRAFADRILTTDDLFEQADLPDALAVMGLGAVGVEMGQALARIGIRITGVSRSDRIAGLTDPEINAFMRDALSRDFPVYAGSAADVAAGDQGLAISVSGKRIQVEKALASIGRRPNVAGLGLATLGVQLDDGGVPEYNPATMQIGDLPIFIAGDANAGSPVLHEAADEGRIAGFNAVQKTLHCFRRRTRLNIVFSEPNVAAVGRSYPEIKEMDIAVGEARFERQGRARIMGENAGILRVYASRKDGRLLGAEMAAPRAEHLAHLLAWAIQKEMKVSDMLQMPFYHPVVEEGLQSALRELLKKTGLKRPGFELAICDSSAVVE